MINLNTASGTGVPFGYNHHSMRKADRKRMLWIRIFLGALGVLALVAGLIAGFAREYDLAYRGKIYGNVSVDGVPFGNKSESDVSDYFDKKSTVLRRITFTLAYDNSYATISGDLLDLKYDATLSATQAMLIGRSGHIFSDTSIKFFRHSIDLPPAFSWDDDVLTATISGIADKVDVPVQEALFAFSNGKVSAFKPSSPGRKVNMDLLKNRFAAVIPMAAKNAAQDTDIAIRLDVPIDTIQPMITTDKANSFGIKERIGTGYSEFAGSIPGRIHNVALAASKFNGVLIPPGETFSFNDVVGDISAATGYQSAYIIKDGRTVLGDGGGVCQVSTTLFRAAMNAGLPIVERHEHSYRVHYYEEGGFKPGLDATVFTPTDDLKFKNDTPGYILIQTKTDTDNLNMTFELYGTSDGRKSEVFDEKLWGITPPPPPLYQDDPTLPAGTVRQVDFEAWGAKASFRYRVTRGLETLIDTVFTSNYRPWQAVFLRGTKQ